MNSKILRSELIFKSLRSSGSGGQHVNKVSSKIELQFNLENSLAFSEEEKIILFKQLANKLTNDCRLVLQCDKTRSQHKNKELVIKRFLELISRGLIEQKKRLPTKTPKSVNQKRLSSKRMQSEKKTNRKKPNID